MATTWLQPDDVARLQWESYVESRVNHLYDEKVTKPIRKRVRPDERPIQAQEDALLLYARTRGF